MRRASPGTLLVDSRAATNHGKHELPLRHVVESLASDTVRDLRARYEELEELSFEVFDPVTASEVITFMEYVDTGRGETDPSSS